MHFQQGIVKRRTSLVDYAMCSLFKVGKLISAIISVALAIWLSLILLAVNSEPRKEASVIDQTGRMVVTGKNYVILDQQHWWWDVVGVFGPYLVALLFAVLVFCYCSKQLRSLDPKA